MKYKIDIKGKGCVIISEDVVEENCVRRYFFENGDYESVHPDFIIKKSFFQSNTDAAHIRAVLESCILLLSSDQKKLLPAWLLWLIIGDELKK